MLNLSPSMLAKLESRATSFCNCWRLARRGGVVMGFTDHDRDLSFNGVTFSAGAGLSASQLESGLGLAPGTAEASGALTDDSLREADLLNGLYDGASVETWLVDWRNVSDRLLLDVSTIGEVRRGEFVFHAELRSAAHIFEQQQGRAFQRGCSAELGDARCGVNLATAGLHTTGTVVSFAGGVMTLDLAASFVSGFFTGGVLEFTNGDNAGVRLTVKSHLQEASRASIALWTPPGAMVIAGDAVSVTAGCDKSPSTCQTRFNNIVNYRGFPHMPGNDRVIAYPSALAPAMDGGSFFR